MPTCFITLNAAMPDLTHEEVDKIRDIVATALMFGSRFLDRTHIAVRVQRSQRAHMLGDMEIEIFAQFFFRRFLSRDARAQAISRNVSRLVHANCATWINMSIVGYSRVTLDGESFFSD